MGQIDRRRRCAGDPCYKICTAALDNGTLKYAWPLVRVMLIGLTADRPNQSIRPALESTKAVLGWALAKLRFPASVTAVPATPRVLSLWNSRTRPRTKAG
jgi:hypothetical protein